MTNSMKYTKHKCYVRDVPDMHIPNNFMVEMSALYGFLIFNFSYFFVFLKGTLKAVCCPINSFFCKKCFMYIV